MEWPSRSALGAAALVAAFLGLTAVRYSPPAALPAGAPRSSFSGERAREELRRILPPGPHPVGSMAGAQMRDRIAARLRELGYAPELQDTWACSAVRNCARVQNVLAKKPGTSGKWVLISSHYDSVPAGPGAADDGSGVAVELEIARALSGEPETRNGVLFLVNEGEEPGLIGAEAFVAEHPLAKEVGAVVNLEARGTGGPSLMFETSPGNGPILDLYARSVRRPATNSVYYTIYKTLPNDTDLTVYKHAGLRGLNFAFIQGESRYHTPLDDLDHLDVRTLQHQGENALAMVRAFSGADLDALSGPDDAFFDLFGFATLRWPEAWMPALGIAALAALAGALWRALRRGFVRAGQLAWGAAAALISLLAAAAVAALELGVLFVSGAVRYLYFANAGPAWIAFWIAGFAVSIAIASAFSRRAGAIGLWLGTFSLWAIASAVMGTLAPGLAYPFVIPTLAAAAAAAFLAKGATAKLPPWAWLLPAIAAIAVWLPLAWLLYDGLGVVGLAGSSVAFALILGPLAPAWGSWRRMRLPLVASAAVFVIADALAIAAPAFTRDDKQKVDLAYHLTYRDGAAPEARWVATPIAGGLPEPIRKAAAFSKERQVAFPWPSFFKSYLAPAPALSVPPPAFTVEAAEVSGDHLWVRGKLASARGALDAGLVLPEARLAGLHVNGKSVPATPAKSVIAKLTAMGGWVNVASSTVGSEPVAIDLQLSGTEPLDAWVWDATPGLPDEGREIAAARPEVAQPFQSGDRTLVIRQVHIAAGK